jgi:hypothetical protein
MKLLNLLYVSAVFSSMAFADEFLDLGPKKNREEVIKPSNQNRVDRPIIIKQTPPPPSDSEYNINIGISSSVVDTRQPSTHTNTVEHHYQPSNSHDNDKEVYIIDNSGHTTNTHSNPDPILLQNLENLKSQLDKTKKELEQVKKAKNSEAKKRKSLESKIKSLKASLAKKTKELKNIKKAEGTEKAPAHSNSTSSTSDMFKPEDPKELTRIPNVSNEALDDPKLLPQLQKEAKSQDKPVEKATEHKTENKNDHSKPAPAAAPPH